MFTIDSMWDNRSFEHNIRSTSPVIPRLLRRPHAQYRADSSLALDSPLKHESSAQPQFLFTEHKSGYYYPVYAHVFYVSLPVTFPAKLLHVFLVYPMRATCLLCISLS
jgi:hypothetical protein